MYSCSFFSIIPSRVPVRIILFMSSYVKSSSFSSILSILQIRLVERESNFMSGKKITCITFIKLTEKLATLKGLERAIFFGTNSPNTSVK